MKPGRALVEQLPPGFHLERTIIVRQHLPFATALSLIVVLQCGAQGTAFTYQGRLNDGANPANGIYDLQFTIYDAASGGSTVAGPLTNAPVSVSNGLFTVMVDFGASVFTGPSRWLAIGARTNGSISAHTPLTPRQPLTAAPYAVYANSAGTADAVSWNRISGVPVTIMSNMLGSVGNQPLELTVNGQRAVRIEPTTNGTPNIIGGSQANQVDPGVVGATISGGGTANLGGGAYPNRVAGDFSTIGGGAGNFVQPYASVIGGGLQNAIEWGAAASTIGGGYGNLVRSNTYYGTVAGGVYNSIEAYAAGAFVGAGWDNTNGTAYSFIGAGVQNVIQPMGGYSAIVGGGLNTIEADVQYGFIAGGFANLIHSGAYVSGIGGGWQNTNGAAYAVISGGANNLIEAFADNSSIGGGWLNYIQSSADQSVIAGGNAGHILSGARESIIGGGFANVIGTNSAVSFVGGGSANTIGTNSPFSTIAGGQENTILSDAANATVSGGWRNVAGGQRSFVGGGLYNSISNAAMASTIGGGQANHISTGQNYSTIAGGLNNVSANRADRGFIGGGSYNTLGQFTWHGTIGGGLGNATFFNAQYPALLGGLSNLVANTGSVIPGGTFNTNAGYIAVISGGESNYIGSLADRSVIAGGSRNRVVGSQLLDVYATIGGGGGNTVETNASFATIGAGAGNTIRSSAHYAVIPGGASNAVAGAYSLAAGRRAKANHAGSFLWADSTDADFASTASNQFNVRASGGVRLETSGAGMTLDGINVLSGIVPNASLAGSYSSALTLNNANNAFTGAFNGNGGGLSNVNATAVGGLRASNLWQVGGNAGTTPGANFIGTTDNQALAVKVNSVIALQFVPGTTLPNLVGGLGAFRPSVLTPGVSGAVIAGGNAPSGGVSGFGGGDFQAVYDNDGTVGGGFGNKVGSNNGDITDGAFATVAGGVFNSAANYAATVAGGDGNFAGGQRSFVGGGYGNQAQASFSAAGGGLLNSISDSADYAVIGGGSNNVILAETPGSFIGGGFGNTIQSNSLSTVAGYGTIAGGIGNIASGSGAFIGGGGFDGVQFPRGNIASGGASVIGGGINNSNSGAWATIGGGSGNVCSGNYGTVGGGAANIVGSFFATVGGGWENQGTGPQSTVGGGEFNRSSGSGATIAGGLDNLSSGIGASIGGGGYDGAIRLGNSADGNGSVISGGIANTTAGLESTVGGGRDNHATNHYATIPGGGFNTAGGQYSFAAGRGARALHEGSFVWADAQNAFFNSTTSNQFSIRANRGVVLSDDTPSLSFGATTRQMLNLWGTQYGIGVQNSAAYFRSDQEFMWYRHGSHTDTFGDPGPGGTQLMRLGINGELIIAGTLSQGSDRHIKQDFTAANPQEVLEKVAALPIQTWAYTNDASRRHLGPVAQDFHAAFGLNGADDKHIAVVDEGGVALAAIQGLNQKVELKDHKSEERIQNLEVENARLKQRLEALEQLVVNLSLKGLQP